MEPHRSSPAFSLCFSLLKTQAQVRDNSGKNEVALVSICTTREMASMIDGRIRWAEVAHTYACHSDKNSLCQLVLVLAQVWVFLNLNKKKQVTTVNVLDSVYDMTTNKTSFQSTQIPFKGEQVHKNQIK